MSADTERETGVGGLFARHLGEDPRIGPLGARTSNSGPTVERAVRPFSSGSLRLGRACRTTAPVPPDCAVRSCGGRLACGLGTELNLASLLELVDGSQGVR